MWVVIHGGARSVEAAGKKGVDLPSPMSFGDHSWFDEVQLIPLVVMAPSVRDESDQISKHAF